jgi:DNA-binding XRE family transcriptional regulator
MDLDYQPVPHDHEEFIRQASLKPGFKEAYDALEGPYRVIHELLSARTRAGLTQEAVAERMGTTKSAVSRLEGAGKHSPSVSTLRRYAEAVGHRLEIKLVPDASATPHPGGGRKG